MKNNYCDGSHCTTPTSVVKLYPLGGGGNLILCQSCWAHENRYRKQRGAETKRPRDWPILNWETSEAYPV